MLLRTSLSREPLDRRLLRDSFSPEGDGGAAEMLEDDFFDSIASSPSVASSLELDNRRGKTQVTRMSDKIRKNIPPEIVAESRGKRIASPLQ